MAIAEENSSSLVKMSSSVGIESPLLTFLSLRKVAKAFPSTLVRSLPRLGKFLLCLLFLLNIRSWPLVWHFRVFRDVITYRIRYHVVLRAKMLLMSPMAGLKLEDAWLDSISPVGVNPFKVMVPYRSWAGIDDCDFNGHLSNSSYGKVLDFARMKSAIKMFPMFFRVGGWIPLAATHFHFIREIPMFKMYEIRTTLAAWDHKWAYLLIKLVCKADKKKKKNHHDLKPATNGIPVPQVTAGSTGGSTSTSDFASPTSKTPNWSDLPQTQTEMSLNAVATQLAGEDADGDVVHTLHVSQICFKIGRITVPPSLVLGANGFTGSPGSNSVSGNPHAGWLEAKKYMSKPMGGSPKKMRDLMTSGWRDVPEGERWWDQALGPEVEAQRVKNLALIESLRRGLEYAGTL